MSGAPTGNSAAEADSDLVGVERDRQAQPERRTRDHRLSPGGPAARRLTQRERVLAALRHAGAHGIDATQLLLPNVADGGPPIVRLPARIDELRQAGHHIEHAGRRNRCAVYRLIEADAVRTQDHTALAGRAPQLGLSTTDHQPGLFGPAVGAAPPRSPYDCREAA